MARTEAQWRLRTSTGQELAISAHGREADGPDDAPEEALPYPLEFLPSDIEGWLAGPDAWSRSVLFEMCEALGGGGASGGAGGDPAPALLEAFARGELRVRVRQPSWRLPPSEAPAPEAEAPAPAVPDTAEPAAREQRRIAVRLGDLDAVFEAVTGVHGKKQRLQALGHYYERFTPATGGDATPAFGGCLAYWRAKREHALRRAFADDADLEADMQDQVRRFVVAGGALPPPGGETRVRLPGAVTCEHPAELMDGGLPDGWPLPPVRFDREGEMWDGNGGLGKLPLVARVELRRGDGAWEPAAGERVRFELVPPFHDQPSAELADVRALRGTSERPPATGWPGGAIEPTGPRQFVTAALAHAFDEDDPQRYNAHHSRGGKRGLPLLGNLFAGLPAAAFPDFGAPETSAAPHPHAVCATANAAGEAGVLFLPARTAGDRYRLRVSLDRDGDDGDRGTAGATTVFETGRLCVWRHILWSTYLAKPAPRYPPANTAAGVQARLATLGYDAGEADGDAGPRTHEAVRAFQRAHHPLPSNGDWTHGPTQDAVERTVRDFVDGGEAYRGFGPAIPAPRFATMVEELRRMYCELEIEPAASPAGRGYLLGPELHRAALRWAIRQVEAAPPATFGGSAAVDVGAMFSEEFETPFLFEIRHPRHYNRLRRPGSRPAAPGQSFLRYWQDAASLLHHDTHGLLPMFLRYLTGHGTPGLAVLSALATSRLDRIPHEHGQAAVPAIDDARHSGYTFWDRATVILGGLALHARSGIYRDDSFTKTMLHEMGHLLLLRHQFVPGEFAFTHRGMSFREDHHSPATVRDPRQVPAPVPYDRCLMGYAPCEGELCGKCHLKLRGWDISNMPDQIDDEFTGAGAGPGPARLA